MSFRASWTWWCKTKYYIVVRANITLCTWRMVNNEKNWLPWQIKDWFNNNNKSPQKVFSPQRVKNLNIHKAAGPDQTTPSVLKKLEVLAPILTAIFRKSFETGEIPLVWKSANVVRLFKKGEKCKPSNYCPVSLTCICCKIMDHILMSNIMSHNKLHGILYIFQHGFQSLRSCETQLLEFITDVTNNMHNRKQTDILIMNFSKAFDKVGYERLLAKLVHYGKTGKTNNWIRSFLSNCKQTVVLEDERSYCGNVTSVIPQGSVLGLCFFLM